MKSILINCPVCKSGQQETLFSAFYMEIVTLLQDVVLCRDCGCVFRNPHVPDICESAYVDVENWGSENEDFVKRFDALSEEIAMEVPLKAGDRYLDIGSGPGWLTERLSKYYKDAKAVILEPSLKVAEHAKQRNPEASVLPAMLADATLPIRSFSLITACGVDYLFQDHRADLEKILDLLCDGGIFYLERNVFVDAEAYYQQAILDMDDLFGLNARMNTWFLRDQLGEYLSEFFEVIKRTDRLFDTTSEPYARKNRITGYYCRRRPGGKRKTVTITNGYQDSLAALCGRAEASSIESLKILRENGVKRVSIAGQGEEAVILAELIKKHDILEIENILDTDKTDFCNNPLNRRFGIDQQLPETQAILLASVSRQYDHYKSLRHAGIYGNLLPCFRTGAPFFMSQGKTKVQVKAFLPAWIAGAPGFRDKIDEHEKQLPRSIQVVTGESFSPSYLNARMT